MAVNRKNYFSASNNRKYMGASQFKSFMQCEARTLAELNGEFEREESTALLVGSYVDAYFSDELDEFRRDHPVLWKRDGTLKAEYIQANQIIERIERDPLFMKYLGGQKQAVRTGEINGVPFKVKMDAYHAGKAIVDLKVMRDFAPVYKPGEGRMSFIEAWGYDIQGAIYQAVEGHRLPFYIAAVTKEREPDLMLVQIGQPYLDTALQIVKAHAGRFDGLKRGIYEPERCEKCDYCKRTKRLSKIMTMEDLMDE